MFLEYYGFHEQPFGVTPDPRFLFNSLTHREALASLWVGIKECRGFLALVARPGMGKTTLLFHLMNSLKPHARTVFLFQTQCDSRELIRYILADMGIETQDQDVAKMHTRLNEALVAIAQSGKQFVLIIDEAQNLSPTALETVRLLSNFETSRSKLMQIILAGQPQLAEKLGHSDLVQLSQRISILSQLTELSPEETAEYIKHRLQLAGYAGGRLFSPGAMRLIAKYSGGIPRNINNLCFSALSWGCASKKKVIDAEIIREVGAELAVNIVSLVKPSNPSADASPARVSPASLFVQWARTASREWIGGARVTAALMILGLLFGYGTKRNDSVLIPGVRASAPTALATPADNLQQAPVPPGLRTPESLTVTGSRATEPALSVADANEPIIVVKSNQSLWLITHQYVGRYDPGLIEQILRLNPAIVNPDHLEIGQRIRLPRLRDLSEAALFKPLNASAVNPKGASKP